MKTFPFFKVLLFMFILCVSKSLYAQPPGFDNDTSDVPIDGGLSILLAAGIGYGIKKNLKQVPYAKKNKPAPNE